MNRRAYIFLAVLLIWPLPALAHPHIFARYDVTIAPGATGFIKLHFTFKINAPPNPLLTPGAQAGDRPLLVTDMLANLAAHPFFIYLDMDGESVGRQTVKPVASNDRNENGVYVFDLELPDTVKSFSFALYDPSYFDFVWQDSAHSVNVDLDKMTCGVQERQVGKTMWGILRAQYVQCGSKGKRPPPVHVFEAPAGDLSPPTPAFNGRQEMVP